MSRLKRYFITAYMMVTMLVAIHGMWMSIQSNYYIGWIGVVITALSVAGYWTWSMSFKNLPRTSRDIPGLTLLTLIGFGLVIYGSIRWQIHYVALVESLISTGGWLLYVYWYSMLGRKPNAILTPGRPMPSFQLIDETGQTVKTSGFLGSPVIYIFFRGNWCPVCVAQVKELAERYDELDKGGVKVVLISPQPESQTKALAKLYDVPFKFLIDNGNRVAKELKLVHKNGVPAGLERMGYHRDTVYPTVVITNSSGEIIYSDLTDNYRIRPEPDKFIEVLRVSGELS